MEFYSRLLNLQETVEIMILGEGTFHQVHGGAATNNGYCENYFKVASEEYEKLIGTRYVLSLTIKKRHYIGEVREKTLPVWLLSQRKFLAPQA